MFKLLALLLLLSAMLLALPADSEAQRLTPKAGRAGRSGQGITLVLPEQQADVSRFAAVLGHKESFEASGMTTARPKLVYSSRRGRRSRW